MLIRLNTHIKKYYLFENQAFQSYVDLVCK